jgi:L-ascorbate metabolism protein UlaG (beta-lactamase superfamily)
MAQIRTKLLTRLAQLEVKLAPQICPNYIYIAEELPDERVYNLAPGERIVFDGYRHRGLLIDARNRITTDPKDLGRRCEPGGYLLDIVEEIHSGCCYRDQPGYCNTCIGTPVAAH